LGVLGALPRGWWAAIAMGKHAAIASSASIAGMLLGLPERKTKARARPLCAILLFG